jgi:hypothetical protein
MQKKQQCEHSEQRGVEPADRLITAAPKVPTSFDIRERRKGGALHPSWATSCSARGVRFRPAASAKYWRWKLSGGMVLRCSSRGLRYGKRQGTFFLDSAPTTFLSVVAEGLGLHNRFRYLLLLPSSQREFFLFCYS